MNTTIEIYRNYGVLAAEKKNVYTYGAEHAYATCSDKITVSIPSTWKLHKNVSGSDIVESPWGMIYTIDEMLFGNEQPCFEAIDSNGKTVHYILSEVRSKSK